MPYVDAAIVTPVSSLIVRRTVELNKNNRLGLISILEDVINMPQAHDRTMAIKAEGFRSSLATGSETEIYNAYDWLLRSGVIELLAEQGGL